MAMLHVKFEEGNFQALRDYFTEKNFNQKKEKVKELILKEMAEEYRNRVVEAIAMGRAEGPALSKRWAKEKGHSKPWHHNFDLMKSVEVQKMHGGYFTGIPPTATNRKGQNLSVIAYQLETGASLRIPARPLWEPELRRMMAEETGQTFEKRATSIFLEGFPGQ